MPFKFKKQHNRTDVGFDYIRIHALPTQKIQETRKTRDPLANSRFQAHKARSTFSPAEYLQIQNHRDAMGGRVEITGERAKGLKLFEQAVSEMNPQQPLIAMIRSILHGC